MPRSSKPPKKGFIAARVLLEDPDHPHWGVIREACKSSLNASNNTDAALLKNVRVPVSKQIHLKIWQLELTHI